MAHKIAKQIAKDVEKQKEKNQGISAGNQGGYVDSSRNIAVCLDSKELSKSLKNFNTGVRILFLCETFALPTFFCLLFRVSCVTRVA